MRLSISNLAWDASEDAQVASLLQRHGIDAIDVAPSKYFPHPGAASANEIAQVRATWADRGIEIVGMQALLFGTQGFNVFAEIEVREAMLKHLGAVCRVGAGLGATRLVFGSPKNRDRTGLSDEQATDMAVGFFRSLGQLASLHGVCICLEPNPTRYGSNFMTSGDETARIVRAVDHPSIRMQLDTGAHTINSEDLGALVASHGDIIGHVHASEADLLPLGDGECDHERAGKALAERLPSHVVCIEMLATPSEAHLHSIERALVVADRFYRTGLTRGTPS